MKKQALAALLVIVFLLAGTSILIYQNITPTLDGCKDMAMAYLQEQKTVLDGTERIPMDVNREDGRIIGMHMDHPETVDKIISLVTKASDIQLVEAIPELTEPIVYIGNDMIGNNEKLYYSTPNGRSIVEFSLSSNDSLAFLLYITSYGTVYPEVRAAYTEGVIARLKDEITFSDKDIITFENGYLESVDIRTPETAEILFQCIRNCDHIFDYTNCELKPMSLPIRINGVATGTFGEFFSNYPDTNQFISFSFRKEDAERLYDYITSLE